MRCWLAQFSDRPCDGPFELIHLIDKKALKAHGVDPWIAGSFVHGCRYHHANFDNWRLTVPRESLPERFLSLCDELGLSQWLDRRYGAASASLSP